MNPADAVLDGSPVGVYRHWRLERDAEGIVWLTFDKAGASTNTFSKDVMEELGAIVDRLAAEQPKGLVIRSGKNSGFIAGADVEEFTRIENVEDALAIVRRGWETFNRLAALPFPTAALVEGFCMGGGVELALACRYRIAVDAPGTRFALPEVMLGILPGWGGVKRLPGLVGPSAALDMMLTGRSIDARRAKKMGLVDDAVPPRVMENAARTIVREAPAPRALPFVQKLMNGPLKGVVAAMARAQLERRAKREHYPAPYAILELWQRYGGDPFMPPPHDPASFVYLVEHPTTKNLVRIFGLQERMKALGKEGSFEAKRVHVIGAGTMGGDIAAVCALRGLTVTLQDTAPERLAPAVKRAGELFRRRLRDRLRVRDARDRLTPDVHGDGVRHADVIIEAIFENLEVKQKLFADVEARAKPGAILATNTSSLKLADIARSLRNPARLVGLHFFNPVPQLQLVEVVKGERTDRELAQAAAAFVRQIDKLPLPVKDAPGFLVNRVLGPYMANAFRMLDEGVEAGTIDKAATEFGMPMGPIELADTVGLDICAAAGKALAGAGATPPRRLEELLKAGKLGKKTGEGFYRWEKGKAVKGRADPVNEELIDRVMDPYLAEAKKAVDEGIVADADLADAGLIFGTGFAPFRGGPLNYLQSRG
ncbi:MAG TPA: 3-hydroxyacyl-CoA dehydrogenase NAD-binding domain-containing protein [Burkholderiales bacterium]|nr:3-hydroxyacyl-CoA dehydrogenase NAD-binding domain-containing protein [Burkholderiales bacterium]